VASGDYRNAPPVIAGQGGMSCWGRPMQDAALPDPCVDTSLCTSSSWHQKPLWIKGILG